MSENHNPLGSEEKDAFLKKAVNRDDDARTLSGMEDEDDIIDLTDRITPAPSEGMDTGDLSEKIEFLSKTEPDDAVGLNHETKRPVVYLEDAFGQGESDEDARLDDLLKGTLNLDDVMEEERMDEPDGDDHFIKDLGIAIDASHDDAERFSGDISTFDHMDEVPGIALTEEQVETALERVIQKIFSVKIERMLVEVVERTVKQEIEKLKSLIEDAANGR